MIIALEGIPGGGKSTLVEGFVKYCNSQGKSVYHYKPFLRRDIVAILEKNIKKGRMIRLNKIAKPIKELLNEGLLTSLNAKYDIVIIDRFLESIGGIVFAYCYPHLRMKQVRRFIERNICSGNAYQSVVLDVSMQLGMERSEKRRGKSYDDNMQLLFYRMNDYITYGGADENVNIHYIDGSRSIDMILHDFIGLCKNM